MAVMEQRAFACDVGVLVGHAAVRTWVLGARANASDLCARPLLLPSPLHPPCRG
jgi:N-acyl-D-aspartate/D-glutamate deacylase